MYYVKTLFLTSLICLLFAMDASSQQPTRNYDAEWKKVAAFVAKRLPQSALVEVKKIYTMAKKDNQDVQVIKALVFIDDLQSETREDNDVLTIKELEKEIAVSKEPVTSILNSMIASKYWRYYNQHRWNMYDRTKTDMTFKKEDISTWDADDFHKTISAYYLQSVRNEKLLQQTKLAPFDAIIVKGNMRHLRPTLFDLLAHRAIDYFDNDERDISKPAYTFQIDQASAFDPAADFVTRRFVTNDSLSLHHKALLTFQRLIAFHLNDVKPDALIDVDLKRIAFVRKHSVHPEKDQLYFNVINHVAHQYNTTPAAAQAWYLVAAYHDEKAGGYVPYGDSTHRMARVKAKEILENIIKQKDSSEGKINAQNLLHQINSPYMQFHVEKVNVPGQPFRVLMEYRNFFTTHFRLINVDDKIEKLLENSYDEKFWPGILSAKPVKSWQQALPLANDLQTHKVEIKVDALPVGEYMLIASSDNSFNKDNSVTGARVLYVSNISFVANDRDFFVLDRDNGQPLSNASVQVWEQRYDGKQSKVVKEKLKAYQADANGFFRLARLVDGKNPVRTNPYLFEIKHGNDRLFMKDVMHDRYYHRDGLQNQPKETIAAFLFMDRSLYRPGQTVFFKGIFLKRNISEKTAVPNPGFSTTIYLRDANYQNIDSIKVKTNEYGSVNGKFQLPQGALNGQFSLVVEHNQGPSDFQVEEYKRPKFYVEFEPLKGTFTVNDKIKVNGIAKAYAGNVIGDAVVKYRVVREPRFLYPWMFRRWWMPPAEPLEIAHGEIKTDKDGRFVIEFTAIPDLKIDKKFEPAFDYRVYVDITDLNGETRSGEKMIAASYKSLLIKTVIPPTLATDSLRSIFIRTENFAGEFEPSIVRVTITKLHEEKRLIRDRYWDRPDQFLMAKQEYLQYFPYDEYDNETDPASWTRGLTIFDKHDSVKQNGEWSVVNKYLPGYYVVEVVAKDNKGQEVKDVQYIELFDEQSKELAVPKYLWSQGGRPVEPGETARIKIGTAAENVFVVQTHTKGTLWNEEVTNTYSFVKMNREKRSFDFPITEKDRGNFAEGWLFVKHNRVFQSNHTIEVPWTNKELNIEYASFRDKLLPGAEERWKIKITGYKKELVAAEMLAGMYDASLDQFYPHQWNKPSVWPVFQNIRKWSGDLNFTKVEALLKYVSNKETKGIIKIYDRLLSSAYDLDGDGVGYGDWRLQGRAAGMKVSANAPIATDASQGAPPALESLAQAGMDELSVGSVGNQAPVAVQDAVTQIRKNFNETAFFFPELRTDASGSIEFSFTIPEALTRWKFMTLAHTKEAAFGISTKEIITQKQLMVQPNAPRFVREGDKIEFSTKIVNLTEKELTGQAELQLIDATTNQPIDGWFKNMMPNQYFTVAAGQSESVKFPMEIPFLFNKALIWRIVARSGDYSDGEENALPVLTNRMLVTETLPLNVRGGGTKEFKFDNLLKSGNSETLKHHALTIEYTSNPAWYAVQALPYLMEYPYDCSEQTWNRYYANSLATMISNSSPRIKQVFEKWKITDTAALLSNLQKNQELKAVLLEETPWVLQANSEAQQKKNIALLFDMIRMNAELNASFEKLRQMQLENGGFVWFKGGQDDRYITQYIVTGIGHLRKLKALTDDSQESKLRQLLATAIPYLDRKIKEDYDALVKNKTDLKKHMPWYTSIHYLYLRSFFPEYKIPAASQTAYNYFRQRAQATWTQQNKYMQGLTALALHRTGDLVTPKAILKSLKETSITNEELGMYWKDAVRSWWWYEAPVERQALLIEAFQEIAGDTKTVDDLRTWLLKNKQTNNWNTTKATAEACYALLLQGTNWLSSEPTVVVKMGSTTISSTDNKQEAGTGYFKSTTEGKAIQPAMGNISVSVSNNSASTPASATTWGAAYWQYFEDLDKIGTAATPLKLVKKLFIEKNTDRGPVLSPVNEGQILNVGDKIKVRIELRVDRAMEYVHMKDMRAAAMEPVNVISGYKWQGGLGYYETTKDASTNFFFNYLPKGTYVFEYALFVTHTGNFSNGITSIQCMYAPEFSAHSEGIRVNVE